MFLLLFTFLTIALIASVSVSGQRSFLSSDEKDVNIKLNKESAGAAVTGGIIGTILLGPIGGILTAG